MEGSHEQEGHHLTAGEDAWKIFAGAIHNWSEDVRRHQKLYRVIQRTFGERFWATRKGLLRERINLEGQDGVGDGALFRANRTFPRNFFNQ